MRDEMLTNYTVDDDITMIQAPYSFQFGHVKCNTHTIPELLEELRTLLNNPSLRPRGIRAINAHIFNLAAYDDELREILNASRIVVADGMAIVWAAHLFGGRLTERCNMTESFRAFLAEETMPKSKAILVGCRQEEVNLAADNIMKASVHCAITRAICGFADDSEYVKVFSQSPEIDLILIGMGTPRSERLAMVAAELCPNAIVWHVGGGTIRIFAGSEKEAPKWCRQIGIQWVYRLCIDPKQMWNRYLLGNPKFIKLVLWEAIKRRISD